MIHILSISFYLIILTILYGKFKLLSFSIGDHLQSPITTIILIQISSLTLQIPSISFLHSNSEFHIHIKQQEKFFLDTAWENRYLNSRVAKEKIDQQPDEY